MTRSILHGKIGTDPGHPWSSRGAKIVRSLVVLFVAGFATPSHATEQFPEHLVRTGSSGRPDTLELYSYPLQPYLLRCMGKSPFRMTSTANYRGYISTWELSHDSLFLAGLRMEGCDLSLDSLFGPAHARHFFAGYYCGYLTTSARKRGLLEILRIEEGRLVSTFQATEREYFELDSATLDADRFQLLKKAQEGDFSCECPPDGSNGSRAGAVGRYLAALRDSIDRADSSARATEKRKMDEKIVRMCSRNPGQEQGPRIRRPPSRRLDPKIPLNRQGEAWHRGMGKRLPRG